MKQLKRFASASVTLTCMLAGLLMPIGAPALATDPPPAAPALTSPTDGATVYVHEVPLDWEPSVDTATGYYLEVDNNSDFSSKEDEVSTGATDRTTVALPSGTYYWRVTSCDNLNCGSPSTTRTFIVAADDVYVDDDYAPDPDCEVGDENDGHCWDYDAFDTIQGGLDAVAEGGTVHVADGTYAENFTIATPGITLIGDPGDEEPGADEDAPLLHDGGSCDPRIVVSATGVTIEGLHIVSECAGADVYVVDAQADIHDNTIEDSEYAVFLADDSSDATVWGNQTAGHAAGVVIAGSDGAEIYDNVITEDDYGIYIACIGPCDVSGASIHDNQISGADSAGIYYAAGDQDEGVVIGPDNDIHDNDDGIYFDSWSPSVVVNGNSIHDNDNAGLNVDGGGDGYFDVTGNWWGDPAGPDGIVDETDGDSIENSSDAIIMFRPFCTDEDCDDLSVQEATTDDLEELFFTGTLRIEGSDFNETSSISVNEDLTLSDPSGGSVDLLAGTVITKTGGGDFDATTIDLESLAAGTITGLDDKVVGALQWGASEGLTFNPAITLHIFVGASLHGKTLDVFRSPDSGATWTQDGIEAPKTCIVSTLGVCTFQATKASVYAATSSGSGGGGGGSYLPGYGPSASPSPTPAPSGRADPANLGRYGLHEGDVTGGEGDPDVYIVNAWGFKRLFLNPTIFNFYGHLGGFAKVRRITALGRDTFPTSGLFRNCEADTQDVYAVEVTGEDTGTLHHVQLSGDAAVAQDPDFFKKVFCINNNEFNWYSKSTVPYTSLSQVPAYMRR